MFRSGMSTTGDNEEDNMFIDWPVFIRFMSVVVAGDLEEKCMLVYAMFDANKTNDLEREDMISFYMEFFRALTSEQNKGGRKVEELKK
jgi:Ca2+-binding EF-hand superfamily protein